MSSNRQEKKWAALEQEYLRILQDTLNQLKHYTQLDGSSAREQHVQQIQTRIEFFLEESASLREALHNSDSGHDGRLPQTLDAWRYAPFTPPSAAQIDTTLFGALKHHLLARPAGQAYNPVVLHGSEGVGKSALAALLAADEEVIKRFSDGIFWLRLGLAPEPALLQARLFNALGQPLPGFVDPADGLEQLGALFASRACLLILDDVHDIEQASAFNLNNEQTQILLTTTKTDVAEFTRHLWPRAEVQALNALSSKQATALLGAEPGDTAALAEICQGNPQALRMALGMVTGQGAPDWSELAANLEACEPAVELEHCPPALLKVFQAALDELGEEADYYFALGVFYDYTSIPEARILMLWQHMFQVNAKDGRAFLERLLRDGLLNSAGKSPRRLFSLHSFQYEYLNEFNETDEERKLHGYMLAAYLRQCQQGWVSGPDDGYFFDHLAEHLFGAGRRQELKSLLLDLDWLRRKIKHSGLLSLIADMGLLEDDDELSTIQHALINAVETLTQDKKHLATELLDGLWENKSPGIQTLLNQAKELEPSWEPPYPDPDL